MNQPKALYSHLSKVLSILFLSWGFIASFCIPFGEPITGTIRNVYPEILVSNIIEARAFIYTYAIYFIERGPSYRLWYDFPLEAIL